MNYQYTYGSKIFLFALGVSCAAFTPMVEVYARNISENSFTKKEELKKKYKIKKQEMEDKNNIESINISGQRHFSGGIMRHQTAAESRNSIGQDYISKKPSAVAPFSLLATLPGVNFGSSDPLGLAIRQTFEVRGLGSSELGYVLEGMQGIDQAYYQPYMETWASSENISDITLIQGSSRITDPVSTASGGEVIMTIRDPSDKFGGHLDFSAGSNRARRVFARVDTGYIGNTGVKMFGSYAYSAADLFMLSGRNRKSDVNYKVVKEWQDIGKTSIYFSYSNWNNPRINTTSLSNWEKFNKIDNNFSEGNLSSNYIPNETKNYWKSYIYKSESYLLSMQNVYNINRNIKLHINPYFRHELTNAPGQANVSANSLYEGIDKVNINDSRLYYTSEYNRDFSAKSNTKQKIFAEGMNLYFDIHPFLHNTLQIGYWYDNFSLNQLGSLTPMDENGNTQSYTLRSQDGAVVSGSNYDLRMQTHAFYIGDTHEFLNNKLKISAGFREMLNYVDGTNHLPGNQRNFGGNFSAPMPRVSISFDITKKIQIYVNGITNSRAPVPNSTYATTYNITTGKVSQAGAPSAKPEYTIGEELGLRYHGKFLASLSFFNMNLTHHQISTLATVNGALVSQAITAGGETIRGVSAEIAAPAYYGFSPYINGQYMHGTMDNNMQYGGVSYHTAGKIMVKSPKFVANIGVNYQRGPFFANLSFRWVDSQYSTFMNDQTMPAYKTIDLGLGYRLPSISIMHSPVIRLNFTNLTNVKYLGSVASPTVSAKVSQPGYYISAPMTALMTVGTDF